MKKANEPKHTNRAVAYCRFSSDMQREESIDAQLRAIREYAERNGLVIVAEYIDRAKSATSDQRPEFQRMIREAASGGFSAVIIHKLDRFARNRYDSAHYRHQLKRHGVTLRSVMENLDGSPESIIMESVLEGMAEYYSRNLAREVMKGLTENALQGKSTGGTPPLGYDVDRSTMRLVINEREAEAVRLIYAQTLACVSYNEIIDELNALGYKGKRGTPFGKNSLNSILKNPKYTGTMTFNRSAAKDIDGKRNGSAYKSEEEIIRVKDAVPQIISQADFDKVQEKLKHRMQTRKHSHAKETYLLTGTMVCGVCGGSYVGSRRKRMAHGDGYWVCYGCNRRFNTAGNSCRNKEVNRDQIEGFVLGKLSEYVFSEEYIPRIAAEYNEWLREQNGESVALMKAYRSQMRTLATDISNTADLLIKVQSDALIEKLQSLERSKRELEGKLARLEQENQRTEVTEDEVRRVFLIIREQLTSGKLQSLKQIVDTYIQKIEVFPDKITIMFNFFPDITLDMNVAIRAENDDEGCADTQPSFDGNLQLFTSKSADDSSGEGGI